MALIEFRIEMSDLKNERYLSPKKEIEQEENVGRSQQEREKQNPTFGVGKKTKLKPTKPHFRCLLHLSKFDFSNKKFL